jgi:hypothetical protein
MTVNDDSAASDDANQYLIKALESEQNRLAGWPSGKDVLRFYLLKRKQLIRAGLGDSLDRVSAQGVWYLVEPFLPKKIDKKTGEEVYSVQRDNLVEYIRDICNEELTCRREDLKIFAGGRAELYFNGDWYGVSWDNIEQLKRKGSDGIIIEKEGMSQVFVGSVEKHGIAIVNTRGFFVDYVDDMSKLSMKHGCNFVLIRDLDPSGLLIEKIAKELGIPCIGVNDEMLQYLELTREQVRTPHDPTKGKPEQASHWKHLKNEMAPNDPEVAREIPFLSKWRIEIDKVHVTVGTKKLFEYILHKLKEHDRDLNRVAHPPLTEIPDIMIDILDEMKRIGKNDGIDEASDIWQEQRVWTEGICEDVEKLKTDNATSVRLAIEKNNAIYEACEKLKPILEELKKVEVQDKYPNLETDKLDTTIWVSQVETPKDEDEDAEEDSKK